MGQPPYDSAQRRDIVRQYVERIRHNPTAAQVDEAVAAISREWDADHTTAVNPVPDPGPDGAALRYLYAKADRAARCTHGADCTAHPDATGVHVDDITSTDVLHAVAAEMRIKGAMLDDLDLGRIAGLLGVDAPPKRAMLDELDLERIAGLLGVDAPPISTRPAEPAAAVSPECTDIGPGPGYGYGYGLPGFVDYC
jgi:hypothetical protein